MDQSLVVLAIGAICLAGGFVLVIRGVGGDNSTGQLKFLGVELQLARIGPGAIFALFGVILIMFATQSRPGKATAPAGQPQAPGPAKAQEEVSAPKAGGDAHSPETPAATAKAPKSLSDYRLFEYRSLATGGPGEFRRVGDHWEETAPELANPRIWEPADGAPPGRIRLRDGDAQIEIEPSTNSIYYKSGAQGDSPYPYRLHTVIRSS